VSRVGREKAAASEKRPRRRRNDKRCAYGVVGHRRTQENFEAQANKLSMLFFFVKYIQSRGKNRLVGRPEAWEAAQAIGMLGPPLLSEMGNERRPP
jgi:hypothetical protein